MASPSKPGSSSSTPDLTSIIIDRSVKDEHQGVPPAIFFEDVEGIAEKYGGETVIMQLQNVKDKYKFWEVKFGKQRARLENKIPDVRRAIEVIKSLEEHSIQSRESGKPLLTSFELSDSLYARAKVPQTSTVNLWLGANVMVEYSFQEATDLLKKNLEGAEANLKRCKESLEYIRDQVNIVDVNMTRIYNAHIAALRKSNKGGRP